MYLSRDVHRTNAWIQALSQIYTRMQDHSEES